MLKAPGNGTKGMPMVRDARQIRQPDGIATASRRITDSVAIAIDALIPVPDHEISDAPTTAGFAAMQRAFAPSGGLVRADDLALQLRERQRVDYVSLARMIAGGDVCSYEWQRILWLPMFQFDPHDLAVKQSARMVLDELGNEFRHWALAAWFARPNPWLADRRPVDLMRLNPLAVMEAACADRYIAARQ